MKTPFDDWNEDGLDLTGEFEAVDQIFNLRSCGRASEVNHVTRTKRLLNAQQACLTERKADAEKARQREERRLALEQKLQDQRIERLRQQTEERNRIRTQKREAQLQEQQLRETLGEKGYKELQFIRKQEHEDYINRLRVEREAEHKRLQEESAARTEAWKQQRQAQLETQRNSRVASLGDEIVYNVDGVELDFTSPKEISKTATRIYREIKGSILEKNYRYDSKSVVLFLCKEYGTFLRSVDKAGRQLEITYDVCSSHDNFLFLDARNMLGHTARFFKRIQLIQEKRKHDTYPVDRVVAKFIPE